MGADLAPRSVPEFCPVTSKKGALKFWEQRAAAGLFSLNSFVCRITALREEPPTANTGAPPGLLGASPAAVGLTPQGRGVNTPESPLSWVNVLTAKLLPEN